MRRREGAGGVPQRRTGRAGLLRIQRGTKKRQLGFPICEKNNIFFTFVEPPVAGHCDAACPVPGIPLPWLLRAILQVEEGRQLTVK